MTLYEETLNKIASVFHKFLNYRSYFKDNYESVSSYLEEINPSFSSKYPYLGIPIAKAPTYLLFVYGFMGPKSPTVRLFEDYKIGRSYDASYDEAIVMLIINKFSFEEDRLYYLYSNREFRHITLKDLFIVLVGRDTYETIRRNIR